MPPQNNLELDEIREKLGSLWGKVYLDADKLRLLALIHNHNTAVSKNNYPKTEFIYMNEDWTINRAPNRLRLSEEDRNFLQKYVKT